MTPYRLHALRFGLGAFLAVSVSLAARADIDFALPVQVRTDAGIVEGSYNTKTHIETYFGVPFARPPIGALRWKAPESTLPWNGVRPAKAFGPRAVQAPLYSDMLFRSAGLSEDCLYLNIWNYAPTKDAKQPVLVYFYGGGFNAGDASEIRYDGERMARRGIVTVTVNYRLNVFGFLALPELSAESGYKASGNYGLMDQIAALQWVKRNIAAFGGDPDHVTIAGESAGSMSVSLLMASPLARGLFIAAIGESGAAIPPIDSPVALSEAEKEGQEFAKGAGGLSLAQLRALNTREVFDLYEKAQRPQFDRVVDGHVILKPLTETFSKGEQARVPLLVGWNSQEMGADDFYQGKPATPENFEKCLREEAPKQAEALFAVLPHATHEEALQSGTIMASDKFMGFGTWTWSELHRRSSGAPVYRYLYAHPRPAMTAPYTGDGKPGKVAAGAVHSSEIEYVLGNVALSDEYAWTGEDYAVSKTLQGYFEHFIKTGNPNGDGLPDWPANRASDTTPAVMRLDLVSKAAPSTVEGRYKILQGLWGQP